MSFHSLDIVFSRTEFPNFNKVQSIISPMDYTFGVITKKSLLFPKAIQVFFCATFQEFYIGLYFNFRSVIYFLS